MASTANRRVAALMWLALAASTALAGEPAVAPAGAPVALSAAQALARAVEHNRELAAARRALEAARADAVIAGERPNATLSLNTTSINPEAGIGAGGLWSKRVDTVVRVDQLIERGNKRALRVAAAEQGIAASRVDLADTERRIRGATAIAYYDLLLTQRRVAILRDTAALARHTLAAAEKRLRAGDVSPTDVARIRVDALRADNDLRQAEADRARAQSTLAALLGMEEAAAGLVATDDWPVPQPLPSEGAIEGLIARRADVRAAATRVRLAENLRELVRAQRTRDVTVGVQYEHFPPDGRHLYGVGVSMPLFTGHEFEGEVRRAEVERAAAEDAYARARAQAYTDIAQARADLQSAADRAARFRGDILEQARRAADAAEFAYLHGALGVMDLLDARRTLKATLLDAEAAMADYAKAFAAWNFAIEGYERDEQEARP